MRCEECGFDFADVTSAVASGEIVARAESFASVLDRADPEAGPRRVGGRWTTLEYGGHVRDMLVVQRERVLMARMHDVPEATPMGRDERAEWAEYEGLDASELARQVRDCADWLARTFSLLGPDHWQRRLVYTYPERAERTLEWLAANVVHELVHHEMDIRHNLRTGQEGRS
ncbi:DinB family protein [Georgenia halophila]